MTSSQPAQLVLDLPHRSALDAEDFLLSQSNGAALDVIDGMAHWPHRAAFVAGPAGSGKSHLANVWRLRTGAILVRATDVVGDGAAARLVAHAAVVVEDVHQGIPDEQAMFHLLNLCRQGRGHMLLTSRVPPGELTIGLPDLRSRVRSLPLATIAEPDEDLLQAVLVKLFADRQLVVDPAVIGYLMVRMERSMAGAGRIVAEIDRLALAMHRRVTRQLAGAALERLGGGAEMPPDASSADATQTGPAQS
ncbi:MAG: hypothetical protein NW217_05905 [Hyphomicrobiaceae bacterium]|nr:hypothetical protein [Hyphomicrobiaceae bacterium]